MNKPYPFLFPSPKAAIPVLKLLSKNCPFAVQKKIAEYLLLQAFRQAKADGDLKFLADRCVGIEISNLNYRATISLKNNRLTLLSIGFEQQTDVCIRGNLSAFIQLANRHCDPDSLFFQRRLCIQGDTDLGLEIKNCLDAVDLDELPLWMQKGLSLSQSIGNLAQAT